MALIPKKENTVHSTIEDKQYLTDKREYLGMSGIGGNCPREIWYSWRWAKDVYISARIKRLFNRGHLEEPIISKDLTEAGMFISDDQLEIVHFTGHSKGHIDGLVSNVPGAEKTEHLLEMKTMKDSKFKALKKKQTLLGFEAALKELHSKYWCQVQSYMGYLYLTRCLFVITNKDTDERIYERVKFYPEQFTLIKDRIIDILSSLLPPPRISERQDWYECKMCNFNDVCFNSVQGNKNCRTCVHADLLDKGIWQCSKGHINKGQPLLKKDQLKGCNNHTYLEGL